jgi:uncharacterized membrane protein (DUF373 family)
MGKEKAPESETRDWIARAFTVVEDVVYLGLGVLLAGLVIGMLVHGFIDLGHSVVRLSVGEQVIALLDKALLVLLIVEVLYTVQVSFREHAIAPEPFILVGLISVIRRVLVLTAEIGELDDRATEGLRWMIIELAVLGLLIVALAGALALLRSRRNQPVTAERA